MYSTVSRERENLEHVVISFFFLFSPTTRSLLVCSRYCHCHCHAITNFFFLLLVHCKSFPVWATPSGTPPRATLRTWSLIVTNFLIFCMATASDCATTICSVTNLSLRSPPAVCSVLPQKSGSTTVILCVSNMHPVVHFRVFLSAFSPFRLFAPTIHKCHRHSTQRARVCVLLLVFLKNR